MKTISIVPATDKNVSDIDTILDNSWLKSTFIIADKDINESNSYAKYLRKNRYTTTADRKFTSSAPGMNLGVNPKAQFTRYADPRRKGKLAQRTDINLGTRSHPLSLGMGSYYSEAIDDNQRRIYMQFGTPQYLPIAIWLHKAFDPQKVVYHGRGAITTVMLRMVDSTSTIFGVTTAPLLSLTMFIVSTIASDARFYSVKTTMYSYWGVVEDLLNKMVARRTMLPWYFQDFTYRLDNEIDKEQRPTASAIEELNKLIPDIVDGVSGRISIFALALRSQAAFNKMKVAEVERNENNDNNTDFTGYRDSADGTHDGYFHTKRGGTRLDAYLFSKAYEFLMDEKEREVGTVPTGVTQPAPPATGTGTSAATPAASGTATAEGAPAEGSGEVTATNPKSAMMFDDTYRNPDGSVVSIDVDPNDPEDSVEKRIQANLQKDENKAKRTKFKEYIMAELSEGASFAVFNVENGGSVGESFSSSFASNPIEDMFNSVSTKARQIGNALGGLRDTPMVGDAIKVAMDAAALAVSNASSGLVNPLLGLAYGVNVTMPKIWDASSATLPRSSYKMKLISPYGNAYSQLFNIYVPLAMIMAASLPRATGTSSYMHPFYCKVYDRGRANVHIGMVGNLQITRGTSNLSFSRSGHANAIDIDFDITNLDEVIALELNSISLIKDLLSPKSLLPDLTETPMTSYLNTVMAVDVYSQFYRLPRIRLKIAEQFMKNRSRITAPDAAMYGMGIVDTVPLFQLTRSIVGDNSALFTQMTQGG